MEKPIKPVESDDQKGGKERLDPADTDRWPEDPEAVKYTEAGDPPIKPGEESGRVAEEAPAPKK